jgi:L-histidine Nalpha-methyltransferase
VTNTHLDVARQTEALAADVRTGLSGRPKTLPPKYFYDAVGSELFDQITRLEEYYPTRTEREILRLRAADVAALTQARTLVEIGSGTSEKTRLLLHALRDAGTLQRFVAFDVDPAVLTGTGRAIAAEFRPIEAETIVGDFEQHLTVLPRYPRRLVAFLGSTIGNLEPAARVDLLRAVRATMGPDDAFLLGTDLVKPVPRLIRAYDDAAGVTAAFNKNVLAVINRELEADFDPATFDHVAIWDASNEWIEMRLRSRLAQTVHIRAIDLAVSFDAGEEVRTEISAKFRRGRVEEELRSAGLTMQRWWTDPVQDFALSLSVRTRSPAAATG